MENNDVSKYFEYSDNPDKALQRFMKCAAKAGVPYNWQDPSSGYTFGTVIDQINDHYGMELFPRIRQQPY